jgi:hypothetical protein
MKIIAVDNFDNESVSDLLVCENISDYHGNLIVKFLNDREGDYSPYFYRLVSDYIWEP